MAPPNRILRPDDFQTQLDALAQRIKDLETAPSLNSSSIRGGALTVLDDSSVPRLTIGKQGDGTYGLRIFAADGTTIRDEFGQLNAYTDPNGVVSAAGYGGRARDATGAVIWDTQGNAQVMKSLGSYKDVTGGNGTGNGNMQTLAATTLNFTLSRQVTVLVLGIMAAAGTNTISPTIQLAMDGTYDFNKSMFASTAGATTGGAALQSGTLFGVWTLAAGAHSCALGIEQPAATAWSWDFAFIQAFQLGG